MRTEHDEHDSFDLHIGVVPEQVGRVKSMHFPFDVDGDTLRPVVYTAPDIGGSSWEQWGEAPWDAATEEYPDDTAEHVVIRCSSYVEAYEALSELRYASVDLIPMRWPSQEGVIASFTLAHDWAEKVFNVKAGPKYNGGHEA